MSWSRLSQSLSRRLNRQAWGTQHGAISTSRHSSHRLVDTQCTTEICSRDAPTRYGHSLQVEGHGSVCQTRSFIPFAIFDTRITWLLKHRFWNETLTKNVFKFYTFMKNIKTLHKSVFNINCVAVWDFEWRSYVRQAYQASHCKVTNVLCLCEVIHNMNNVS